MKDGINDFVVAGDRTPSTRSRTGTKAAAHYQLDVEPGQTAVIRLRLPMPRRRRRDPFGSGFDQIMAERRREADAFYQAITPAGVSEDAANVMRQAFAGMLWSKQYFFFDVDKWLEEHGVDPIATVGRARFATASGST